MVPAFQRVISSRIRRPGSIRVGNSAVSGFEHLQWALQKNEKNIETNPFIVIFPSFSPHFSHSKFFGAHWGLSSIFFTPRSPETTSEIPEWVCGRSTVASGLTAPHFAKLAHGIFITVYISFLISFIFIHRWFLNIIHQASQSIRSTLEASAKRAHLSTT